MCGEEVGGDDSLSREPDVTWTWKIWKALANENAGRPMELLVQQRVCI